MAVREPTGEDEVYLVETALPPLPALLGLARRATSGAAGEPLDWPGLPVTDLAAAALLIRHRWLGDGIRTEATCPHPDCRELIDVGFSTADYLRHHRPRLTRGVLHVPTVADLLEVGAGPLAGDDAVANLLTRRCVAAAEISRALARRLDRAFSGVAPSLDDLVGGSCPECGHAVTLRFEPLAYTLAELRDAFSGIYLQTHALASAYGWPEEAILALPRGRRIRYASIIASQRAVA
jgi:hypothetical protein